MPYRSPASSQQLAEEAIGSNKKAAVIEASGTEKRIENLSHEYNCSSQKTLYKSTITEKTARRKIHTMPLR